MKFVFGFVAVALVAAVYADVSHLAGSSNHYLPPSHQQHHDHHAQYLPPHHEHRHAVHVAQDEVHHQNGHHRAEEEQVEPEAVEEVEPQAQDAETATSSGEEFNSTDEKEPTPAHRLEADGYHYKIPSRRRFFF